MAGVSCEGAQNSVGQLDNVERMDVSADRAVSNSDEGLNRGKESGAEVAATFPQQGDADLQKDKMLQPLDAKATANGEDHSRSAANAEDASPLLKEDATGIASSDVTLVLTN